MHFGNYETVCNVKSNVIVKFAGKRDVHRQTFKNGLMMYTLCKKWKVLRINKYEKSMRFSCCYVSILNGQNCRFPTSLFFLTYQINSVLSPFLRLHHDTMVAGLTKNGTCSDSLSLSLWAEAKQRAPEGNAKTAHRGTTFFPFSAGNTVGCRLWECHQGLFCHLASLWRNAMLELVSVKLNVFFGDATTASARNKQHLLLS